MLRLLKYLPLPSFIRGEETTDDEEEPDNECASSDGTYDDCINDEASEHVPDDDDKKKKKKACLAQSSIYPPLSSIATGTQVVASSSDLRKSGFVDLDEHDDFDITNVPFSTSFSSGQTKGSTVHKNNLQTFCQRKKLKLPTYRHSMDGPSHAPKFTAAVDVNGETHYSSGKYNTKGEAEQAAAKVALSILQQQHASQDLPPAATQSNVDSSRTGLTIPTQCSSAQQLQYMVHSAKVNNSDGRNTMSSRNTARGFGVYTNVPDEPPPFEELTDMDDSRHKPWTGGLKDSLQNQNSSSSDCGVVSAGLERKTDGAEIAAQFSRLQVGRNAPVGNVPSQAHQTKERNLWEQYSVPWPQQTQQLDAIGKLDFATQAFPLLARLDRRSLEEVYTVSDIEYLLDLHPSDTNRYLWDWDGFHRRFTTKRPPPKEESDPSRLLYDCYINDKGEALFKVAENKQGSTSLLQRVLGYDKVLRVFFECGPKQKSATFDVNVYRKFVKTGIFVGPRLYRYCVHKSSDDISNDEEKRMKEGPVKCYFACTDSRGQRDAADRTFQKFEAIDEVRSLFMHADNCPTVAKYMARMQLCLSKTVTIDMPWADLVVEVMEDLPCEDPKASNALFTDGTGFISTNLMKLMPISAFKGVTSEECQGNSQNEYPSLVQIRFFYGGAAYKGTLLVHSKKVQSDPLRRKFSINSFELVSTTGSRDPRCARLSTDLIVLLSIGGVPESIILDVVEKYIKEVHSVLHDRRQAHRVVLDCESSNLAETTRHMIAAGIPLQEPGLKKNLIDLSRSKLQDVTKGRVPLKDTFYLMGTVDPSGTLEFDKVVIYRGKENVRGTVLLYRAPGKHPGDVHKVKAVHCEALEEIVGRPKNVIFFSTNGRRPLPHEIAKGDLDGDMYWICENKEVVESFTEWKGRWYPGRVNFKKKGQASKAPKELLPADLEEILFDEYLDEQLHQNSVVKIASTRWLAHVDAFLHPDTSPEEKKIHEQEFLKYPDYIYEAVDTKSGVQLDLPEEHKLIKGPKAPYLLKNHSANVDVSANVTKGRSILGKIYDLGRTAQAQWQDPSYGPEHFQVDPAFLVPDSHQHRDMWYKRVLEYCGEMSEALKAKDTEDYNADEPERIYRHYRMLLYGAPSLKQRKKDLQKIFEEASAIYEAVYWKAANDLDMCKKPSVAFAWNVAGVALASIYAQKQPGGDSIVYSPEAYNEIFKRKR